MLSLTAHWLVDWKKILWEKHSSCLFRLQGACDLLSQWRCWLFVKCYLPKLWCLITSWAIHCIFFTHLCITCIASTNTKAAVSLGLQIMSNTSCSTWSGVSRSSFKEPSEIKTWYSSVSVLHGGMHLSPYTFSSDISGLGLFLDVPFPSCISHRC